MHAKATFCLAIAAGYAVLATVPASAELNLWISYYFAGEDRFAAGEYQEAAILLDSAGTESAAAHRQASALDARGRVHVSRGQFQDALGAFQEALRLKEKSLGARHRFVPETLNNLGDLHFVQGDSGLSEDTYRHALDLNKRDQLNIEVCRSLNGLALLHHARGEDVEAEGLLRRAVRLHEKAERRDHPYLATCLVNLGILCTNQGRLDEAGDAFLRAEYIQDRALRADHPDVAVRLTAQAAYYRASGLGAGAMAAASRARDIYSLQRAAGNTY